MKEKSKREIVELQLNMLCQEIDLCRNANDPYPCEEEDEILTQTQGLITFYEEDADEFFSDSDIGKPMWIMPSDEQVERLYPIAQSSFE